MNWKIVVIGTSIVTGASVTVANDWPQWRGPSRDGQLGMPSVASFIVALVGSISPSCVWPRRYCSRNWASGPPGSPPRPSTPRVAGRNSQLITSSRATEKSTPLDFLGVDFEVVKSDLTGGDWVKYGDKPVTLKIPYFDDIVPTTHVSPPLTYLIPPLVLAREALAGAGRNAVNTERWKQSVLEVIRRDRNHPSVIIWGLLNEMGHPKYVNEVLPMIRELDATRMVWSNSAGGGPSNPGSNTWDDGLRDGHPYFLAPLSDKDIATIRSSSGKTPNDKQRHFVTEGGWLVARDMPSDLAQFQRLGKEQHNDALFWRGLMDAFMADWKQWKLNEIWKRPEDYFADAHRNGARVRDRVETAFRSLPGLVGLCPTQKIGDQDYDGGGLTTFFREPKVEELFDGARLANAPLRWCLFATPIAAYRGRPVRFEVVLADLDTLRPGAYPVRIEIPGIGSPGGAHTRRHRDSGRIRAGQGAAVHDAGLR